MQLRSLLALAGLAAVASAQANLITNGSFESGINPGSFTTIGAGDSTSITGWTVGGASVDYIGSYWNASNGVRSIDLAGNDAGSVSQTVNGLTAGTTYYLSFDLAGNPDGDPTTKVTVVGADMASVTYNVLNTGTRSNMSWATYGFSFVALGSSATISFASGTPGSPYGPALDNVMLSAPGPAGAVAFAVGLLRRRRKA